MLKLISDENFNADILRGLFRRRPELGVVRVQDIGLNATPDREILAWAAVEGRIMLTHDRDTIPHEAFQRVTAGLAMPGVFLVSDLMPIGQAIDGLLSTVSRPKSATIVSRFFHYRLVRPCFLSLIDRLYRARA